MESTNQQISEAIARMPANEVIVAADFKYLGSSTAVRKSLSRLAAAGTLHRLGHGLYAQPQTDPILGLVHPAIPEVALLCIPPYCSYTQLEFFSLSEILSFDRCL